MKGKILPQEIELEKAIIGSLISVSNAIDVVLPIINTSDVFFTQPHRLIFDQILKLTKENKSIDMLILSHGLKKDNELENVGGDYYLIQLIQMVSSTAHLEEHCFIVFQSYIKRHIASNSQQLTISSYENGKDSFELLEEAQNMISGIEEKIVNSNSSEKHSYQNIVEDTVKLGNKKTGEVTGIPTGLTKLNDILNGWQKTDLTIIAARPGMGKTSLALLNALTAAKSNFPVLFYSMEMSERQLKERLLSMESDFTLKTFKRYGITDIHNITLVEKAGQRLEALPIYIEDKPALSAFELKINARMHKRKHKIELVIVDYLQLMSGGIEKQSREQEISHISRSLKELGKELDVPVIALSQLSRSVETRGGAKRPILSDLRESGSIEQDADQVIFIYRPEYYNLDPDPTILTSDQNTEGIIAKNRHGEPGSVGMYWQGGKVKFYDNNPASDPLITETKAPF